MKFLDTDHPFFRPLLVRLAVVAVAAGWGVFELWMGSPVWATVFFGFAAVSVYGFFIDFNPPDKPDA